MLPTTFHGHRFLGHTSDVRCACQLRNGSIVTCDSTGTIIIRDCNGNLLHNITTPHTLDCLSPLQGGGFMSGGASRADRWTEIGEHLAQYEWENRADLLGDDEWSGSEYAFFVLWGTMHGLLCTA